MWKEGSSANKFEGNDLKVFTHNFVSLADWFREKSDIDVSASVQWHNFLTAISIWPSINRFLIEQRAGSDYPRRIEQFEEEVNKFYECGRKSFLIGKKGNELEQETTYIHILRYQISQQAKETYERHGLAIGIFTLKAVKQRNAESKFQFINHNNGKGNLCKQILKRNSRHIELMEPKRPSKNKRNKNCTHCKLK